MNKLEYRIVSEVSAPRFYDIDTNELLGEECDDDVQAYWVVSYNPEERYIEEWIDRFYDVELARDFKNKMEKGETVFIVDKNA